MVFNRKTICIIQYNLGAPSETFLTRHIQLLEQDFDVYCITGKVFDNAILPNTRVFNYSEISCSYRIINSLKGKIGFSKFIFTNRILQLIENINPSLVIFQFGFIPVEMGNTLSKIKCPFVIIHHGTDVNKAREDTNYHRRLRKVWRLANHIIFISQFLSKTGVKLGCNPTNSSIIPLGVPFEKNILNRDEKDNSFKILSIGRLVPVKNHRFLINAFSKFNADYPNSELTLIGDGPLKQELEDLINDLNLKNKIRLTGALDFKNVKEFIANTDVVCLVSKQVNVNGVVQEEGFGLSLIEGAMYKKPLIGTYSGGIPEIVENDITGLLVKPDNINELASAFKYVHDQPLEAKKMGENAYRKVKSHFDQKFQIEKFIHLYKSQM